MSFRLAWFSPFYYKLFRPTFVLVNFILTRFIFAMLSVVSSRVVTFYSFHLILLQFFSSHTVLTRLVSFRFVLHFFGLCLLCIDSFCSGFIFLFFLFHLVWVYLVLSHIVSSQLVSILFVSCPMSHCPMSSHLVPLYFIPPHLALLRCTSYRATIPFHSNFCFVLLCFLFLCFAHSRFVPLSSFSFLSLPLPRFL